METWKTMLPFLPIVGVIIIGILTFIFSERGHKAFVDHIKEHQCCGVMVIRGDMTTEWHPNEQQPNGTFKKSEYQLRMEAEKRAMS